MEGTNVLDLRPILNMDTLGWLDFRDTPAASSTDELAELSNIRNDKECAEKTKAYLKTLPPWPEPLDWDTEGIKEPPVNAPTVELPGGVSAPLMVIEENGKLRPATPGDGLDPDGSLLSQQAWEALRDYLADLASARLRIHNTLPQLERALSRLERALGESYQTFLPVAAGLHGRRVIRQSESAAEVLMEGDAADVAEFAAALVVFLERFPEWKRYLDAAAPRKISLDAVQNATDDIADLNAALTDHQEIDPGIPQNLADQIEAVKDTPDDKTVAIGLLDSASNLISKLGTLAMPAIRWCTDEAIDIGKTTWSGVKKGAAGGLAGVALDLFVTKGATIRTIAEKLDIDWLLKFLNAFGL